MSSLTTLTAWKGICGCLQSTISNEKMAFDFSYHQEIPSYPPLPLIRANDVEAPLKKSPTIFGDCPNSNWIPSSVCKQGLWATISQVYLTKLGKSSF